MENKTRLFEEIELFVGIDVHKKQWSVSIYAGQIHHRTFSQQPDPSALRVYLEAHFPGASVKCAYEALHS